MQNIFKREFQIEVIVCVLENLQGLEVDNKINITVLIKPIRKN